MTKRVLVAEDDDDVRLLVVTLLRKDGHDVCEACNGHELLERLARSHQPPDAIVTDIRMPGIDGLSVLMGLRDTGWATPLVLISAHVDDEVRARAIELRADALFQKPFELADLRRTVQRLLRAGGWRAMAPTLPDSS